MGGNWTFAGTGNQHSLSLAGCFSFETEKTLMSLTLEKEVYDGYAGNTDFSSYTINRISLYVLR